MSTSAPSIRFMPSRPLWVYLLIFVLLPVALGILLPVVLGDDLDAEDLAGVLGFLALIVALVVGVQVPLMLRHQRRRRARLLGEAAPGALFAELGRAFEIESANSASRTKRFADFSTGLLVVGRDGLSYLRANPRQHFAETRLTWSEIKTVEFEAEPPTRAVLRVLTTTDQVLAWRVTGGSELRAALLKLQQPGS